MRSRLSEVLKGVEEAETRLEVLSQEFRDLESEKAALLQEIMRGARRTVEVKKTDRAIQEKSLVISEAKEQVGKLRVRLETQLAKLRKDLIKKKQRELDHSMRRRARYLKRMEELEVEKSRYRYLITGEKNHRLAKEKDLLPRETQNQGEFVPMDEIVGRLKLQISKINRLSSKALLEEYLAREKDDNGKPKNGT